MNNRTYDISMDKCLTCDHESPENCLACLDESATHNMVNLQDVELCLIECNLSVKTIDKVMDMISRHMMSRIN